MSTIALIDTRLKIPGESIARSSVRMTLAYANGGKLRVRTDQEQQLWSECSRLLANCIIYYNACILSELLERAERRQDYQRADAIKRANPASWKHVNLYGAYSFLDIGDGVDLQ